MEENKVCSICGKKFTEWGNNAYPINDGTCCDDCNVGVVIPSRILRHNAKKKQSETR